VGLVRIRRAGTELSFEAPHLRRSGAVEPDVLEQAVSSLGIASEEVLQSNWMDNGPGWLGIRLATAQDVLDLKPDFTAMGDLLPEFSHPLLLTCLNWHARVFMGRE
jgi:predicted PhzF superfamily epimerase YddE/YHI9